MQKALPYGGAMTGRAKTFVKPSQQANGGLMRFTVPSNSERGRHRPHCYHYTGTWSSTFGAINLTPEQERIVKDELQAGHFRSVEEVIDKALQALRDKEKAAVASCKAATVRSGKPCGRCLRSWKRIASVLKV
jgi:hypothetical protein